MSPTVSAESDGAIALAGREEIPECFSVAGQLKCEINALSKYVYHHI